jgi:hypothetical protein
MPSQTLKLEAIKDMPMEEVIARVLQDRRPLTVWVSNEQEVVIEPRQKLVPLPVLDGYIPQGWKDAVYDE